MSCTCCPGDYVDDKNGYQHDATFNGVDLERHCTDVCFLVVFIAFIIGLFVILFITLPKSNAKFIYIPTDHRGLLCGYNNAKLKVDESNLTGINLSTLPDLSHKKFLFWIRPGKPGYSRSFCVEECPKVGKIEDAFADIATLAERQYRGHPKGSSPDLCGGVELGNVSNYSDPVEEQKYFCPYVSKPFTKRCLPTLESLQNATNTTLVQNVVEQFSNGTAIASHISQAVESVYKTLWVIVVCTIIAVVVSIVWLLLLRFCAGCIVWLTVLLAAAALAGVTFVCWAQWKDKFDTQKKVEDFTFGFVSQELNGKVFKVFFIIMIVLDVIFVLLVIFLYPRLQLSITILKLVAGVFGKVPSLFLLPLGIAVLMIVWWVATIGIGCVLFGAGKPVRNFVQTINNDPYSVVDYVDMEYDGVLQGMAIYDLIALLWGTCFLVALGEMTVAGVVSQYYFTSPEDRGQEVVWCNGLVTTSLLRSIRYHTGSLALGSFIITIFKLLRILMEYIDQKTKNQESDIVKFVVKCMKCCLWCFEKLLKYLNRNAYILIAIHGYGFCAAAGHAFGLIIRNAVRAATVDFVGDFALFLGRVFVSGLCTVIAMFLFPVADSDVQNVVVPAVLVLLCAWFASATFTSIFEMGIDSMFLCYLEDEERNDGTPGHEKRASAELQNYIRDQKSGKDDTLTTPMLAHL